MHMLLIMTGGQLFTQLQRVHEHAFDKSPVWSESMYRYTFPISVHYWQERDHALGGP